MASVLGQVGFAMSSAYVAAKHGVLGMTEGGRLGEHAADGVRVNAVGPGFIMTPLLEANLDQAAIDFPGRSARAATARPAGRGGRTRRLVGQRCVLLVTGAYYPVDGGYLAR